MNFVFRNNRFQSVKHIEASNRGFLYGDGFFETMLVIDAVPAFWNERVDRISRSLNYLRILQDFSFEVLLDAIMEVSKEQNAPFLRARLTIVRDGSGKYLPGSNGSSMHLNIETLSKNPFNEAADKRAEVSTLLMPAITAGNHKLIGKHAHVLAALEAQERSLDDLIVFNERNEVCESVSGNIYAAIGGQLFTPLLNSGCLEGIVRQVLLKNNLCRERCLTADDIQRVDGWYSSNSISGISKLITREHSFGDDVLIEGVKGKLNELILSSVRDLQGNQP